MTDLSYEHLFRVLTAKAGIPATTYAIGEVRDETLCLNVSKGGGYEVFYYERGAKRDRRFFPDDRAAYYYLFGLLAASALRADRLAPTKG